MLPPAATWSVWVWVGLCVGLLAAGAVVRNYIEEHAPYWLIIIIYALAVLGAFAFGIEYTTGEVWAALIPTLLGVLLLALLLLATIWDGALAILAILSGGLSRCAAIVRRINGSIMRRLRRRQPLPDASNEDRPAATDPPDTI